MMSAHFDSFGLQASPVHICATEYRPLVITYLYSGGSNSECKYSDGWACSVHGPDHSKTEQWLA